MKFEEFKQKVKIKASVGESKYIVMKVREIPQSFDKIFAMIRDKNEITVIAEETHGLDTIEEEKYFRLITFDLKLPFELIGFMAYISKLLADKGVSILTVSAYSTDHIFVKEENLKKAVTALREHGISVDN